MAHLREHAAKFVRHITISRKKKCELDMLCTTHDLICERQFAKGFSIVASASAHAEAVLDFLVGGA